MNHNRYMHQDPFHYHVMVKKLVVVYEIVELLRGFVGVVFNDPVEAGFFKCLLIVRD